MSPATATPKNAQNSVTISDVGPSRKKITIEIPADTVSGKLRDSIDTLAVEAELPGFRKGRVPRRLVEKRFGSAVRKEAKSQMVAEAYTQAIEEHKLKVIGEPSSEMLDDRDEAPWEHVHERPITPDQWERYQSWMAEIFSAFGMHLQTPGTLRTPERFLQALFDATVGYEGDPKLVTAFPTECRGGADCRLSQVIEGPIPFYALCEHHAFPFFGVAHVGYVAHEHIIGISKLTRLVRVYARRFTVQERIGQETAGDEERQCRARAGQHGGDGARRRGPPPIRRHYRGDHERRGPAAPTEHDDGLQIGHRPQIG